MITNTSSSFTGTHLPARAGDATEAKVDTTEDDKAWFAAYVADRRRRGVHPLGEALEGEPPIDVATTLAEARAAADRNAAVLAGQARRVQTCDRGHVIPAGRKYCAPCERISKSQRYAEARAAGLDTRYAPARHCRRGHELVGDNVKTITTKAGVQRRYCQACKKPRSTYRTPRVARCKRGHAFTAANTIVYTSGVRACRTCDTARKAGHAKYDRNHPRPRRSAFCTKGHLVEGENMLVSNEGYTSCRECNRQAAAAWNARKAGK